MLKAGGKFLFWEHVLSKTDDSLCKRQIALLTPQQMKITSGCRLDRRTGDIVKDAGFKECDVEYFELLNFDVLNPTVCGIAIA